MPAIRYIYLDEVERPEIYTEQSLEEAQKPRIEWWLWQNGDSIASHNQLYSFLIIRCEEAKSADINES